MMGSSACLGVVASSMSNFSGASISATDLRCRYAMMPRQRLYVRTATPSVTGGCDNVGRSTYQGLD